MADQLKKILVVDDEEVILELLEYNLEKEGYKVYTAGNGLEAVEVARAQNPDLILLDIMMPGQDGVETCRQIRKIANLSDVFVIFLTARSEEYSEIAAFDVGADDYIVKPIKPRALMSRINAFFRRTSNTSSGNDQLKIGKLEIDKTSYTVSVDGQEVILPKKEFELLYFLMQYPNKVFNREELLQNIWGADVYVLARTVDVHIRKIREKIGENYIKTIKGVGYKFDS
jgi:two-component system alkaline phosphatase synthesis response regulator PhoP